MRIDRCVCHLTTFETMKRWCDGHLDPTFEQVQREFRCGTGCGLCAPYVRRMLRTGETVFHQVLIESSEPPSR